MLLESEAENLEDNALFPKGRDLVARSSTPIMVGHAEAQGRILGLIQANRLPHALLVTGPQGIGKKIFARQLAAVLLSDGRKESSSPDGFFNSYISSHVAKHFYGRTHPNVWDEPGSEAPEFSSGRIEDIRSLLGFFQRTSGVVGARVGILPDLHLFNRQALNALLKGLEEPPVRSFLIVTSHKLGSLPKTVLSRLDKIHLSYPNPREYEAILKAQAPQIDQDSLVFLRHFSEAPGMALLCFELGGAELYKNLRAYFEGHWGNEKKSGPSFFLNITSDWLTRVKNKQVSFERVLSVFALFLNMFFVKESPYSLTLSGEEIQMAHERIQEAHKIMRETLSYDLDQRQCLLILFSLFTKRIH